MSIVLTIEEAAQAIVEQLIARGVLDRGMVFTLKWEVVSDASQPSGIAMRSVEIASTPKGEAL